MRRNRPFYPRAINHRPCDINPAETADDAACVVSNINFHHGNFLSQNRLSN
jgi:hypothetical protein